MVQVNAPKKTSRRVRNVLGTWSPVILIIGILLLSLSSLLLQSSDKGKESSTNIMVSAVSAQRILASAKPYLVYGTAWKKEETARLVAEAIESGFRFIDTACQPKHYNEAGVGEGWTYAAQKLGLQRSDLYIQTKFTSLDGQDRNRLPYDKDASLEDQVRQSLDKSLKNLKTDYLDALVMHSPMNTMDKTIQVWRLFESFVDEGKVLKLGISNCYDFKKFKKLYEAARIKPVVLQNRFYEESNFDTELRAYCKERGVRYQSFWTLTANRHALATHDIREMARAKNLTPQTLMYVFMMSLGHTPLDGTTNQLHMMEDVAVMERMMGGEEILNEEEIKQMGNLLGMPEFS